ncbi:MAG: sugar transporter, partial [Bacteroidetes bacterium]|nr:sugar transporter [Bacteroidota bacterium]
ASSLISYFINYRETLLGADQKNYVIVGYLQTSQVIKSLVQMCLAYYTKNYYYWVIIELTFGFLFSIVLNKKIDQTYPWLSTNIKKGKQLFKKYPDIIKYTKQLFVHKIAEFVLTQTSPFLVFTFSSLRSVAFFSNYTLITDKISGLINNILGSTGAGVGNLVAEGDEKKIKKVFWELTSIRYFVAGIFLFSLYNLIEPFISIWLGSNYIMNKPILILILANSFIMQTRGTIDQYLYGYGLFSDVWAPFAEAALNLGIAILCGSFWGIEGVLMGPLVSMTLIVCIWKPYFLYNKGFKTSIWSYWLTLFKYFLILTSAWILSNIILKSIITINPANSYKSWILYALITTSIYSIISFILMYMFTQGIRDFIYRIINKIRR